MIEWFNLFLTDVHVFGGTMFILFLAAIVGFFLYIVWKDESPKWGRIK